MVDQELENEFNNAEAKANSYNNNSSYKSNNYNSNYSKGNTYNKGNYQKKQWSGKAKPAFDKINIDSVKLDTSKIHFSLDYRSYGLLIANTVEVIDQQLLERMKNIITILESKGYLFRGFDPKEGMKDHEKQCKETLKGLVKEVDKYYSGFAYKNDESKTKSFGVVKGLHAKYTDLNEIIKCFLARDVELVVGENHNKPITLAVLVMDHDVDPNTETKYAKLGNLSFLINVLKQTSRPFFNINTEEGYSQCLEFVNKLGTVGTTV